MDLGPLLEMFTLAVKQCIPMYQFACQHLEVLFWVIAGACLHSEVSHLCLVSVRYVWIEMQTILLSFIQQMRTAVSSFFISLIQKISFCSAFTRNSFSLTKRALCLVCKCLVWHDMNTHTMQYSFSLKRFLKTQLLTSFSQGQATTKHQHFITAKMYKMHRE